MPWRLVASNELIDSDRPLQPQAAPPGTMGRGDVERLTPREPRGGRKPSTLEPVPVDELPRRSLPGGEDPDQAVRGSSTLGTGESLSPDDPSPGDVTPARLGITWRRLVGLLVRLGPGERWHGALADLPDVSPAVVSTLTGSWGLADLESGGQIVLGSDTAATLQVRSDGRWEFQMERGQLGLRSLLAETEVEFRAGEARWTVRSEPSGAAVALVIQQGQPQLWIRRGEVQVDGSLVRAGRRIAWTAVGSGSPEPLAESSIWMDRPPRVERIPDAIQTEVSAGMVSLGFSIIDDRTEVGPIGRFDLPRAAGAVGVSGQQPVAADVMVVVACREGTDDGHLVGMARGPRQKFAEVDPRDIGGNGPERAANVDRRLRLGVECFVLRWSSLQP